MYFDQGFDGFPAFGVMPGSDIKSPYRLSLPERLYADFSIVCTVSVKSSSGGFIFAVVNPLETVRPIFIISFRNIYNSTICFNIAHRFIKILDGLLFVFRL